MQSRLTSPPPKTTQAPPGSSTVNTETSGMPTTKKHAVSTTTKSSFTVTFLNELTPAFHLPFVLLPDFTLTDTAAVWIYTSFKWKAQFTVSRRMRNSKRHLSHLSTNICLNGTDSEISKAALRGTFPAGG
jgi:hypothetical protein